jgi:hypothetical protein
MTTAREIYELWASGSEHDLSGASEPRSLEPREAKWLSAAVALATLDGARIERAAANAGLALEQKHEIGSEWRERMIEDGEWDANEALLQFARMRRLGLDGSADAVDHAWGVYQLLGKLCPTVYVWEQRG